MRTFSSKLNTGMLHPMDIYQIRKHNLVKLIGSQRKGTCAERWGMAPAHLSQILSDKTVKNLGDDVARRIEGIEGLPRGWFDALSPGEHAQAAVEPGDNKLSAADLVKQMLARSGKGISEETRQRLLAAAQSLQMPRCWRPSRFAPAWSVTKCGSPTMTCGQPWVAARSPTTTPRCSRTFASAPATCANWA